MKRTDWVIDLKSGCGGIGVRNLSTERHHCVGMNSAPMTGERPWPFFAAAGFMRFHQ